MSRTEYEDPVEQVMFILGFKHDPRFDTSLHAIASGSNPGILDALDQLTVYGAVEANFHSWRRLMEKLHDEAGPEIPLSLRDEIYRVIVDVFDEEHYGGKWFPVTDGPREHWVNMGVYSPIFRRRETEVFCLPAPYLRLMYEVFA